ncbi:MAG TPA: alpha/beta hydrolase [Pseudonocardia sp.]|jgi:arylformamidase|nr:alpha/beta hydrolase [Pseudonocardia sp.]
MALYREFETPEQLNAQYNLTSDPGFPQVAATWDVRSAATRARLGGRLDVQYGPTLAETVDIFPGSGPTAAPRAAPGAGLRPAVLLVHGGYWMRTSSKQWSYLADGLAPHGITTVVENYALCPEVTVTEIVRQHRAAFAWLWHNAAELGIDRDNIVLAGHSAGGHAVAALLGTDWVGQYGLPAQPFRGAVPVSGIFDLRPLPYTYLAQYLQLTASEAAALSPLLRLPEQLPPTLVAVGADETSELRRLSRDWARACQAKGLPVELQELPGDHFHVLEELADPDGALARAVVGFLAG